MKKRQHEEAGTAVTQQVSPRVTPIDIQQKEFRLAFRGYNERDVDVFLDQLTEEVARLNSENKRLREQMQFRGTMSLDTSASPEGEALIQRAEDERHAILRSAQEEAGRIVAEARTRAQASQSGAPGSEGQVESFSLTAFIAREREFLQSLASLVQSHAEGVKANLRVARQAAAAGASQAAISGSPGAPEPTSPEDRPELWRGSETASARAETPATQIWAPRDVEGPGAEGAGSDGDVPAPAEGSPVPGPPPSVSATDADEPEPPGRADEPSDPAPPAPGGFGPGDERPSEPEGEESAQREGNDATVSQEPPPEPPPPPVRPPFETGSGERAAETGGPTGANPLSGHLRSPAAQPRQARAGSSIGDEPEVSSLRELFWGED